MQALNIKSARSVCVRDTSNNVSQAEGFYACITFITKTLQNEIANHWFRPLGACFLLHSSHGRCMTSDCQCGMQQ